MTLYERLYAMMVRLKVSDGHPAWYTPVGMVGHIALRLNIHTQKTGKIKVDEETVSWLESHMPTKKRKLYIKGKLI
jgi:hypothetical protein